MANRPLIINFINKLLDKYKQRLITETEFTTVYLLFFLKLKYNKNFLQRYKNTNHRPNSRSILILCDGLIEFNQFEISKLQNVDEFILFSEFNLKGIPQSVNRAMINWIIGNWDIVLSFKIPSSRTLLNEQVKNKRILTLITDEKRITTLILGKRDPLSFAIHDLMHADQFFNNKISLKGQLGFYQYISEIIDHPILVKLLDSSPSFKEEFEYVVSDMNAYVIHLLKSFVSCFTRIEAETELQNLIMKTNIPSPLIDLILNINENDLNLEKENIIRNFFENNQRHII